MRSSESCGDLGVVAGLLLFCVLLVAADLFIGWVVWQCVGGVGAKPRGFITYLMLKERASAIAATAVSQIAAVVRANLPLAPALLVASQNERGRMRQVLRDLARLLGDGAALSVALRQSVPACPAFVESVARAGEDSGQLPRALATMETMLDDRLRRGQRITEGYWVYPIVLVLGMVGIVSGVMVKVVPKFKEIFQDFDTELPGTTLALISVSEWFVRVPFLGCLWYPALVLFVFLLLCACAWPRRVGRPSVSMWLADSIRWYTPVVRDIDRAWGTAASVEVLGMGCAAGLPLDVSAQAAGEIDVNVHVRHRFKRFAVLTAQGQPPAQAARDAKLGPVVASAVNSMVRGCDPDVALGHAARYHRAMAYRWWHVAGQLVWPAITVVSAIAVGFIALALFEPLVTLIDSMAGAM